MSEVKCTGSLRLAAASALLSLMFCSLAFASLKSTAPKDVDLSGRWKLNPALSEDPHAAIEMAEAEIKEKRAKNNKGGGKMSKKARADEEAASRFEGMQESLEDALTTPEEFAIQQEPEAFVLVLPEATDTCKTKVTGQVSTPGGGKADRQCGWDKRTFVIEVKPKKGPVYSARYELDTEKDRLIVTSLLKGERLPEIQVKRVYERVAG